jgi:hypothetical protein
VATVFALVGALGGAGFNLNMFTNHESEAGLIQQSLLAVIDYRLSLVEKACKLPTADADQDGIPDGVDKRVSPLVGGAPPKWLASHTYTADSYSGRVTALPVSPVVKKAPTFQEILKLAREGKAWAPPEK